MNNRESVFSISKYPDATMITRKLDKLIHKPIYSISQEALAEYEDKYFNEKCGKSKELTGMAGEIIRCRATQFSLQSPLSPCL